MKTHEQTAKDFVSNIKTSKEGMNLNDKNKEYHTHQFYKWTHKSIQFFDDIKDELKFLEDIYVNGWRTGLNKEYTKYKKRMADLNKALEHYDEKYNN